MAEGYTSGYSSRMPSHPGQPLDWRIRTERKAAPHNGATDSFSYIAPTPKYVEAYNAMTGPGWGAYVTYLNYNHGNQPYDAIDSGLNTAFRTPLLPNWYSLSKVVPKTSSFSVQQAQQLVSNMLAAKSPPGLVSWGSLVSFP